MDLMKFQELGFFSIISSSVMASFGVTSESMGKTLGEMFGKSISLKSKA